MTYLITFPCYGSHCGAAGSVDRNHNRYGAPFAQSNPRLLASTPGGIGRAR